jgi:hypothetical protein
MASAIIMFFREFLLLGAMPGLQDYFLPPHPSPLPQGGEGVMSETRI